MSQNRKKPNFLRTFFAYKCGIEVNMKNKNKFVVLLVFLKGSFALAMVATPDITEELAEPSKAVVLFSVSKGKLAAATNSCVGTFVSENHIITAAHCFLNVKKYSHQALEKMGNEEINIKFMEDGKNKIAKIIKSSFDHSDEISSEVKFAEYLKFEKAKNDKNENYVRITNDLAIFKVVRKSSSYIKIGTAYPVAGSSLAAIGYRLPKNVNPMQFFVNDVLDNLKNMPLSFMPIKLSNYESGKGVVYSIKPMSFNPGDSGGPIVFKTYSGKYELIGVLSKSAEQDLKKQKDMDPAIYTDLLSLDNGGWIKKAVSAGN